MYFFIKCMQTSLWIKICSQTLCGGFIWSYFSGHELFFPIWTRIYLFSQSQKASIIKCQCIRINFCQRWSHTHSPIPYSCPKTQILGHKFKDSAIWAFFEGNVVQKIFEFWYIPTISLNMNVLLFKNFFDNSLKIGAHNSKLFSNLNFPPKQNPPLSKNHDLFRLVLPVRIPVIIK